MNSNLTDSWRGPLGMVKLLTLQTEQLLFPVHDFAVHFILLSSVFYYLYIVIEGGIVDRGVCEFVRVKGG